MSASTRSSSTRSSSRGSPGTRSSEAPPALDALVARLSRQSVDKHFDAYADVDWGAPELAIRVTDPRWQLQDFDPIAGTAWYRAQPEAVRASLGLHRIAVTMRTGWEFENILQRGLLSHAFWLANGKPEFRYIHHEVIEESQHTMMFQEFVNRTGLAVRGMPHHIKLAAELFVVPLSRLDPPLFFFFVLGGEDPIDHVQRRRLRTGIEHPLLERIIRIHVTEEARHLSFARQYLREELTTLTRVRRVTLSVSVPLLLGVMVRLMLTPPRGFGRRHAIPAAVVRSARRSPAHRALRRDSVAKIRRLCTESGLMNPAARLAWRLAGLSGLRSREDECAWSEEPDARRRAASPGCGDQRGAA